MYKDGYKIIRIAVFLSKLLLGIIDKFVIFNGLMKIRNNNIVCWVSDWTHWFSLRAGLAGNYCVVWYTGSHYWYGKLLQQYNNWSTSKRKSVTFRYRKGTKIIIVLYRQTQSKLSF